MNIRNIITYLSATQFSFTVVVQGQTFFPCTNNRCCSDSDCTSTANQQCLGAKNWWNCKCHDIGWFDAYGEGECKDFEDPPSDDATDIDISINFDGRDREAELHLPPTSFSRQRPLPLVINIHAMEANAFWQKWLTDFDPLADKEGFAVLYPQGLFRTFNAGGCCPESCSNKIDDVGYIRALVEYVNNTVAPQQGFSIDHNRIFATGMSNGAFMSHRLGCEMSDVIAAIAPVAGVMTEQNEQLFWNSDPYVCNPDNAPIPVLHIHDVRDPLVPWLGLGAGGNFPSVRESINRWRRINGVEDGSGRTSFRARRRLSCGGRSPAECTSYGSGRSNVTLCTVQCTTGIAHSWPGGPGGNDALPATELIWEFFRNHGKET